jgi:hypothetical protein
MPYIALPSPRIFSNGRRREMNDRKMPRESDPSRRRKKPVDQPENLAPTPAAPETEDPQVDEVMTPEERREYQKEQEQRKPEPR